MSIEQEEQKCDFNVLRQDCPRCVELAQENEECKLHEMIATTVASNYVDDYINTNKSVFETLDKLQQDNERIISDLGKRDEKILSKLDSLQRKIKQPTEPGITSGLIPICLFALTYVAALTALNIYYFRF